MENPINYLDVRQAADYLRVSESCIRRWLSTGFIPRHKAGRRVFVRLDELDALIARSIVEPKFPYGRSGRVGSKLEMKLGTVKRVCLGRVN